MTATSEPGRYDDWADTGPLPTLPATHSPEQAEDGSTPADAAGGDTARRDRYAEAIAEHMEWLHGEAVPRDPSLIRAVIAVADAEQAELLERSNAAIDRARMLQAQAEDAETEATTRAEAAEARECALQGAVEALADDDDFWTGGAGANQVRVKWMQDRFRAALASVGRTEPAPGDASSVSDQSPAPEVGAADKQDKGAGEAECTCKPGSEHNASSCPEYRRIMGLGRSTPAVDQSAKHQPFTDDGVTYCGWDGKDGCGEVWPCSTVRNERPTPTAGSKVDAAPEADRLLQLSIEEREYGRFHAMRRFLERPADAAPEAFQPLSREEQRRLDNLPCPQCAGDRLRPNFTGDNGVCHAGGRPYGADAAPESGEGR